MRRAFPVAAASLCVLACSRPSLPERAQPAPIDGGREEAPPETRWQADCKVWLEGAISAAIEREPALRGARVQRERMGERESVFISVMPPIFKTGGLLVRVERAQGSGVDAASPTWAFHAEVLGEGYHALLMRRAGDVESGIGFDGWRSEEVQVLAPIFQRAIEHCDVLPSP
jgi:hypothetical protein